MSVIGFTLHDAMRCSKNGVSASSNFQGTPPARMRLWSASAFDQIDGGIALQRVAA